MLTREEIKPGDRLKVRLSGPHPLKIIVRAIGTLGFTTNFGIVPWERLDCIERDDNGTTN
jgi:hypothetical protein